MQISFIFLEYQVIIYNTQNNHSIILVAFCTCITLVSRLWHYLLNYVFLNSLMQEKPRNHLDLRNRLNSKGQREGKVIDYRYRTIIIIHVVNDEKYAYWKYMFEGDQSLIFTPHRVYLIMMASFGFT